MHAPTAAGTRVDVRDVRRVYPNGVVALDGVNLDVAPGEFVALLGPSGCGKSTLLRLVAGLDAPQAGEVLVGKAPHSLSPLGERAGVRGKTSESSREVTPTDLSRTPPHPHPHPLPQGGEGTKLAYVFQDAHLLPWRSVLKNAALPLELAGVSRAERLGAARAALDQVGLSDAVDRYPNQLSGGMRMRVSIARALVTDPRLLLLDEPFAALDEVTRQRLDEQLLDLWRRRGMTVLFVTHSVAEAVFLAQRAVVFSRRPGRVVLDHRIDLPAERGEELRTTSEFARQSRVLHEALRREEPP